MDTSSTLNRYFSILILTHFKLRRSGNVTSVCAHCLGYMDLMSVIFQYFFSCVCMFVWCACAAGAHAHVYMYACVCGGQRSTLSMGPPYHLAGYFEPGSLICLELFKSARLTGH